MKESDKLESIPGLACPKMMKTMSKVPFAPTRARPDLLAAVVVLWAWLMISPAAAAGKSDATNAPPKLNLQEAPLGRDIKAPISFAPVAKKVGPSVVNIYSTLTIKERPNQLFSDPFFRHFFGDELGPQAQPREHKV